jgi:histidinol-phosphatase (PHP family)
MLSRGVRLVFGSDAHHKSRIGFGKDIASMIIKSAGYMGFTLLGEGTENSTDCE